MPRTGARIVFYHGAEFLDNVGTGYGGAILNHGELDFDNTDGDDDDDDGGDGGEVGGGGEGAEASSFTLNFGGNYCGEQEVSQFVNRFFFFFPSPSFSGCFGKISVFIYLFISFVRSIQNIKNHSPLLLNIVSRHLS